MHKKILLVACILMGFSTQAFSADREMVRDRDTQVLLSEIKALRADVQRLERLIDKRLSEKQPVRDKDYNKWGCYFDGNYGGGYGVGRTRAEAMGKAITMCNESSNRSCKAMWAECSSN